MMTIRFSLLLGLLLIVEPSRG